MLVAAAPVPEKGQLVSVRDRFWIVKAVVPSTLPLDVASGERRQHLVELSSVEDDGLGDELTVIWEIEPGTSIRETGSLPTPRAGEFDVPERLRTFLDAVRWGAIASADARTLQSPFRAGITIEDYQLDPVVRALEMARVNLLIADDVGLGKTIEAGLIIQELTLRHRVRTAWVLCPPSLCLKWKAEMENRFGLEFRIVDAEAVRLLRRERGLKANIFGHFPRLIVSFDWLKMDRPMRLLREHLPPDRNAYPRKIDMLVVDEAHQCAPAGKGTYARPSDRTTLLRYLAPHSEHRLFLSATPHNGYPISFTSLLELLDPQRFARGVKPDPLALQNAQIRRMKADIRALGPAADGRARFPERVLEKIEVAYPQGEREIHALLEEYARSRRAHAPSKQGANATDLITLLLKKRLFSSPAAFAHTLAAHMSSLLAQPREEDTDRLRDAFDRLNDDYETDEDREDAERDLLGRVASVSGPLDAAQRALLERMHAWAQSNAQRADEKARALIAQLRSFKDERVIIFTEYRDTQAWLHRLLVNEGLGGDRVRLLYGGMDAEERERIKAAFQSDPANDPVRILLATDTASEGIDLQRHCARMIHVEIPFNPNRLEQRNGRIDRHGQPQPKVFIYHFVGSGYSENAGTLDGDLDFLFRAATKLETIRQDLGSAGAILATEVENAMLGRSADLNKIQLPPRDSAGVLKAERELRERVDEMHQRVLSSIDELGITPDAIERVVQVGLELGRQSPLEPLALPPSHRGGAPLAAYAVPDLTRSWASACENLYHPVTGKRLPITFDNAGANEREDVVLAHLGHPLVMQAMRLLRAEIWARARDAKLARVTGRLVDDSNLAEPTVILDARLVIMGSDGYRLHEQLFTAGGRLGGRTGFARLNVGEVQRALAARGDEQIPRHHQEEIAAAWERLRDPVFAAMNARAAELHDRMMRMLAERATTEEASLRTVMMQLHAAISREIEAAEHGRSEQLSLFDATDSRERGQVNSDLAALARRLEEIPGEIARESERLRRRYEAPHDIAFPAALTFLVPRRFANAKLDLAGARRT
uniref:Putative helicase SNF2 family protein n=1 Tax=mine drainage metagenome TaxID=410659 RepID=E6Q7N6_9ZZZZ